MFKIKKIYIETNSVYPQYVYDMRGHRVSFSGDAINQVADLLSAIYIKPNMNFYND